MNIKAIAIQPKKNVKMSIDYLFQFYAQRHPSDPFQSYQNSFDKFYLRKFQISLSLVLFSYQNNIFYVPNP